MTKNVFLKEKRIFEENNRLYLKLVYEYEDERGVHELIIPKIDLDIHTDYLPRIDADSDDLIPSCIVDYFIKFNYTTFNLMKDNVTVRKNGETHICPTAAYVINTIKENPHEMTLSEIEKKLGYKVKLVSGTGDDSIENGN